MPSVATVLPMALIYGIMTYFNHGDSISIPTGYNIAAAYSSIAAVALGRYAYKKLNQSNTPTPKN